MNSVNPVFGRAMETKKAEGVLGFFASSVTSKS